MTPEERKAARERIEARRYDRCLVDLKKALDALDARDAVLGRCQYVLHNLSIFGPNPTPLLGEIEGLIGPMGPIFAGAP